MRHNPKMFVASCRANHISHRKVTATDRRDWRGTSFHDTWAEAHAAIVARREAELVKAQNQAAQYQRWLKSAERALEKAKAMKPPGEVN